MKRAKAREQQMPWGGRNISFWVHPGCAGKYGIHFSAIHCRGLYLASSYRKAKA